MKSSSQSNPPHHFLFVLPGSTTPDEQERVVKSAKQLTSMGYVYVASAHERTMEDRENIRYMPLRENDLPRFGNVSGVMVVRDQACARAAVEAYPGASIFVIDPSQPAPARAADEGIRPRTRALPAWQPSMLPMSGAEAA
jgi:hypothetical protein